MTTTGLGVPDRDVRPRQALESFAQGGLVAFDADQQVSTPLVEVVEGGASGFRGSVAA